MDYFLHATNVILIVMALVSAYQAGYTQADTDKTDEHDIDQGNKQSAICLVVSVALVTLGYTMGVLLG